MSSVASIITSSVSDLSVARFPFAAARDPEREQQQLEIETDARPFEIEVIEPEFAGARQIARRVHLREAGEPGTNAVPICVAANVLQRDEPPITQDVHLAGPQRPRADETHVADEDVPELRQLVHGRCA